MRLFLYFMEKLAPTALTALLSSNLTSSHHSVKGVLNTHSLVVNHLFETYATDDIIAEEDSETACCVKLLAMSPLEFPNGLGLKTLTCSHLYDEYVFEGIFVAVLPQSIIHSTQAYWSSH